ncbi:MAG: nucleotidyltransferase domain-containing protein [Candidatus Roizmanbacteria bacterium]
MDTQQIPENIKLFISRIKSKYNPQKIILFGSYARGQATKYSDIDIDVISDIFKGTSLYERYSELYSLTNDLIDPPIQAFGFTVDETTHPEHIPTLQKALNEGVTLE